VSALFACGSDDSIAFDQRTSDAYFGRWVHLAMTARAGGELRLYVDGEQVASRAAPSCFFHSGHLSIGAEHGGAEGVVGLIDGVRFWNVERAPSQIRDDRFKNFDRAPGLVSLWRMDGSGVEPISGNHGIPLGTADFVPSDSPIAYVELDPARGDFRGGYEIEVISDYPSLDPLPEVLFGDALAPSVRVIDPLTLGVEVPPAVVPGDQVVVKVRGEGFERHSGGTTFTYTPRLEGPSSVAIGSVLTTRFLIAPPSYLVGFFGAPPEVQIPVQHYGGFLNIFPFQIVLSGYYVAQADVDLILNVPARPSLVGKTVLLQCIAGLQLDGKSASFSNTISILLE
jgi:hypothetical protein